jgi:hypothetical protein
MWRLHEGGQSNYRFQPARSIQQSSCDLPNESGNFSEITAYTIHSAHLAESIDKAWSGSLFSELFLAHLVSSFRIPSNLLLPIGIEFEAFDKLATNFLLASQIFFSDFFRKLFCMRP